MEKLRQERNKILKQIGSKTLIMGIVNVTPDSFSDGGNYATVERAVQQAKRLVQEGAHIIDIGGESTRPGAKAIAAEEELQRVIPVIEALFEAVDVPISIDTYKAEVAKRAVKAGASIINDIWGAKHDAQMAKVAATLDVPIIVMHNRQDPTYTNLMQNVIEDINESIAICRRAGVLKKNIIIDPGIGFAKTYEENIEVMRHLDQLVQLGYPVLLGTSRKSMIGQALQLPVHKRLEGTGATVCYGIMKGCHIVRVHDVKEMSRMAKMMDILTKKGE